MPKLTDAEIEEGIGKGDIFGLAVDTSIFDRFGCDLRHPKLALLHQLAGSKLQLLLPEIVAREVLDHLARHAVDSHSTASKALIEYRRRWQKDSPADLPAADAHAEALRQLNGFLSFTGGKRIPMSEDRDLAQRAIELYFTVAPPFERRDQKKHEFPDAFALLSLEALAERRRRMILCVSADKGWSAFCDRSDALVCVDDLNTALSYLNSSGRARAEAVWRSLRERGNDSFFYEPLRAAFRSRARQLDFVPEIKSSVDYRAVPVLEDLDRMELETASSPLVIEADDESVTFTFNVKAKVIFIADFVFYASQATNYEATEIAAARRDVDRTVEYDVLLTVARKGEQLGAVREATVDRPKVRVPFGSIDPYDA
ncbi:PIN domain-containing protein [Sphingomonas sp. CFBP 13706]|uniref:PIN domain-containing protein n=1 Tax=Sphingomonas sp. CFBP 13706 TaxID=2775314 RepID=UPI00177B6795|nr:PIN domain-containing protein [Sphingomonas sp. CFBP 13706]MBD8735337.1 DUF4935 domain-containing protein [Sphingomonas sp. CFBP 13706]